MLSTNVRSKSEAIAKFDEHKTKSAHKKIAIEPIYVNRMPNPSVNYSINTNNSNSNHHNNNNINSIHIENDYYNLTENDDIAKIDSIINASETKNKFKLLGKPPSGEKHLRDLRSFCGLSLDEREMPITRERSKLTQPSNSKRCAGDAKKPPKLVGSPKLLRASTCDAYPSRGRNRYGINKIFVVAFAVSVFGIIVINIIIRCVYASMLADKHHIGFCNLLKIED